MAHVRILGPRPLLDRTLGVLQDLGQLHLTRPARPERLEELAPPGEHARERERLVRALEEVERAAAALGGPAPAAPVFAGVDPEAARAEARAALAEIEALEARRAALVEERDLLARYGDLVRAFRGLIEAPQADRATSALWVVLRPGEQRARPRLEAALRAAAGESFALHERRLASGERALLLLVPARLAARIEALLGEARVHELKVPPEWGRTVAEALPRMAARLAELPAELAALEEERARLVRERAPRLLALTCALRDRLAAHDARGLARATEQSFVLEGWLPRPASAALAARLEREVDAAVAVEHLAVEPWRSPGAPVVLRNPRLFRPFEALTGLLPLPVYGSIDPTPYVAVFFPMFVGLILGDVGHGLLLAGLAGILHRRSAAGTRLRSLAEVGLASALFTIAFGLAFGELLGDFGRRHLGLRPLLLDREESLTAFLGLAVALGAVHILLGLVLGAWAALRGHPRQALGRGVSAVLLVLVAALLLVAFGVLPRGLITPAVAAVFVLFPVLVLAEGLLAPLKLLQTLGHVLSYARIMALGTASVLLAVVANRLAGLAGSAVIGVVFALLFHLVNFAIGLLSPAIHALRLHYVEFFGEFYSPGGVRYTPLARAGTAPGAPRR